MTYKHCLLASSLLFLFSGPVIATNSDLLSFPALLQASPTVNIDPSEKIAPNDNDTSLEIVHQGGYFAQLELAYNLNGSKRYFQSGPFGAGTTRSYILPVDATDVFLTVYAQTGLVWAPLYIAYQDSLCQYNNQWWNGLYNEIEVKTWGTSLNPKGALVQPVGSSYNGADTTKRCGVR